MNRQGGVDLGNIRSEQESREDVGFGFGPRHSLIARQKVLLSIWKPGELWGPIVASIRAVDLVALTPPQDSRFVGCACEEVVTKDMALKVFPPSLIDFII
jgi:hypothetical protein